MLFLLFACKKNDSTATGSVATDSSSASVSDTSQDVDATIKFSGLITYVLGPYQRAVVVYTTTHPHTVTIRATSFQKEAEDIVKALPEGDCKPDSCSFKLQYMSLQLLEGEGKQPLDGALTWTDGTFLKLVTPLDTIDPDAFKPENLAPVVTADLEDKSTISWGFVDLHGGDAKSTALVCQGKISENATQFEEFSAGTSVHYRPLKGRGFLRVQVAGEKDARDIPLTGPEVEIEVDNNVADKKSHFHEYEKLTTLANHHLPKVVLDESAACRDAIVGRGGVPGCHDTRINGTGTP